MNYSATTGSNIDSTHNTHMHGTLNSEHGKSISKKYTNVDWSMCVGRGTHGRDIKESLNEANTLW